MATTVAYACGFPAGEATVDVGFAGTFPTAGEADQPFTPGELSVTVPLDRTSLGDALAAEATTVGGSGTLITPVMQNDASAPVAWPGLTAEPAELAAEGATELTLAAPGPEVRPTGSGDFAFYAGPLSLSLEAGDAEPIAVECTVADGQDVPATELATVAVESPEGEDGGQSQEQDAPSAAEAQRQAPADGQQAAPQDDVRPLSTSCVQTPPSPDDFDRSLFPAAPSGLTLTEPSVRPDNHGCAIAAGFAGVRKLQGSTIVNDPSGGAPQTANVLATFRFGSTPDQYFEQWTVVELSLPPARSTFLNFGFVPVTATIQFETGPASLLTVQQPGENPVTYVAFEQTLRASDVRVNGVPLDVGSNCRSARPMQVMLESEGDYQVLNGGVISGEVEIPPFSGCGVAEDLDRLLTATISGPGNPVRFRQSPLCAPAAECTPGSDRLPIPELPEL
ncbi:hypothetical protein RM780_13405 [Streptomyces sp. DSM 44917]|uniref:DUF6801 domain-containing protein n=1 Tax=Streptomyces boetiae TaxID=3075541 RepID=A0ABU2L8Q3_9ACTN|nr:DUF6801 domain-containing protein [Streptomyces sp. DSM 44917]MDT0307954.1 hypothetical protein [Streptomyces sp. DSM 44917]